MLTSETSPPASQGLSDAALLSYLIAPSAHCRTSATTSAT